MSQAEKSTGMKIPVIQWQYQHEWDHDIAVAREIENNQRLQGRAPTDLVGEYLM